jgi:hypothetical protein
MTELGTAIKYVEIIIAAVAAMLLGDYLGYKIKRTRLVVFLGCVVLVTIVGFVIYAAIMLA